MKSGSSYVMGLVLAAAVILSCAGQFGKNTEPSGRRSDDGKPPVSAVRSEKTTPAPAVAVAADKPVPRTDPNSMTAHAQLLEKTQKGKIDIYFEGDSITRRWGATDYPDLLVHWTRHFFGWNAADFGWGGDKVQNILWRIQNGELDGVHPKVIVLLAGANDVGNTVPEGGDEAKVADITKGLKAILETMRTKAPEATLIVTGIFPRNDNMAVMPTINKINDNLSKLADGKKIRYLNINDRLADGNGRLFDGMMGDKLHPTIKGYEVWAEALKPILTELLGPPADTDYGPPPTGDPGALMMAPDFQVRG
jgi:lysophospholipase L1-like esterase